MTLWRYKFKRGEPRSSWHFHSAAVANMRLWFREFSCNKPNLMLLQIWHCDIRTRSLKRQTDERLTLSFLLLLLLMMLQLRKCCDSLWRRYESSSNFCCCWCCSLSPCGLRTCTSTRANPSNSTSTMEKVSCVWFLYFRWYENNNLGCERRFFSGVIFERWGEMKPRFRMKARWIGTAELSISLLTLIN